VQGIVIIYISLHSPMQPQTRTYVIAIT